jgi:acetyl-CoA C-acetyltransferase
MKKSEAQKRGLTWMAEIISYGTSAGPDTSLLLQPSAAIKDSLRRSNLALKDLHLFEINEAFSTVALASMNDLGISMDQVNIWGGATAIGHPVGASGARLVLTLAHQLRERGGGYGVASLCGGGGQGDALLIRVD